MRNSKSSLLGSLLFVAIMTSMASPAFAAETPKDVDAEGSAEAKPEDRSVYLSFSPLHLVMPIVEVTAEAKVHRKIGLAGILGYGRVSQETAGQTYRFSAYEVGGQFVSYPIGHFDHGMQLGMEALYVHVNLDEGPNQRLDVTGIGNGLAVGPFIGYKLATQFGFSFNVQAGAQYMAVVANASADGTNASEADSRVIPLLNLNLGWSF
jgi:opacity protein-like surface antigen